MMGRAGRLTVGVLLLALAGLLVVVREQAVDKASLNALVGIFGIPGMLLLMSGLLPGRGGAERTKMVFIPTRLVGGLSVSVAGAVALYLFYQVLHVAPQFVLIGALLAVPAGLLVAASCWTEACRNCSVPLRDYRARFNADGSRTLEAAVTAGAVAEMLALRSAAPGTSRIGVLLRYCPRCRRVGLVEGPGKARGVLIGDQVPKLLTGLLASRQPDETVRT